MIEINDTCFDGVIEYEHIEYEHIGYSILYESINGEYIEFEYPDNTDLDSYISKARELKNGGNRNVKIVEHILITRELRKF